MIEKILEKSKSSNLFKLTIILMLILICIFVYISLVKLDDLRKKAELDGQRVVFSINGTNVVSQEISAAIKQKLKSIAIKHAKSMPPLQSDIQLKKSQISSSNVISSKPKIAIIIGGLGLNKSITQRAMKLPPFITLGFSSYGYDLNSINSEHDILVNLPLEPINYPHDDPGSHALIRDLTNSENTKRLNFILSLMHQSLGVYSIDPDQFLRSPELTTLLLNGLKAKKKMFVYNPIKSNLIRHIAKENNYKIMFCDIILDDVISTDSINKNLKKLEKIAKIQGYAIGYANPYPITINVLKKWLDDIDKQKITISPISEVYKNLE